MSYGTTILEEQSSEMLAGIYQTIWCHIPYDKRQ